MELRGNEEFFRGVDMPAPFAPHPDSSVVTKVNFYTLKQAASIRGMPLTFFPIITNRKALCRHIGPESIFSFKSTLLDNLRVIRAALESDGLSVGRKIAIKAKLNEGVESCSPGYLNRVLYIVQSFRLPSTVDQLLAKYRQELVKRSFESKFFTGEVHTYRYFFTVANRLGLAVPVEPFGDPIRPVGVDELIEPALLETFRSEYTDLAVLTEPFKMLIGYFGYEGKKLNSMGYLKGEYDLFLDCLKQLLPAYVENIEASPESYLCRSEAGIVSDLNWFAVAELFARYVTVNGYLKKVHFGDFKTSPEGEAFVVTCCDQGVRLQVGQLIFPRLVVDELPLLAGLGFSAEFLERIYLEVLSRTEFSIIKSNFLQALVARSGAGLEVFLSVISRMLSKELKVELFKQENGFGKSALMVLLERQTQQVPAFLKIIDQLNSQAVNVFIFTHVDTSRKNILQIAIERAPHLVELLLEWIKKLPDEARSKAFGGSINVAFTRHIRLAVERENIASLQIWGKHFPERHDDFISALKLACIEDVHVNEAIVEALVVGRSFGLHFFARYFFHLGSHQAREGAARFEDFKFILALIRSGLFLELLDYLNDEVRINQFKGRFFFSRSYYLKARSAFQRYFSAVMRVGEKEQMLFRNGVQVYYSELQRRFAKLGLSLPEFSSDFDFYDEALVIEGGDVVPRYTGGAAAG